MWTVDRFCLQESQMWSLVDRWRGRVEHLSLLTRRSQGNKSTWDYYENLEKKMLEYLDGTRGKNSKTNN